MYFSYIQVQNEYLYHLASGRVWWWAEPGVPGAWQQALLFFLSLGPERVYHLASGRVWWGWAEPGVPGAWQRALLPGRDGGACLLVGLGQPRPLQGGKERQLQVRSFFKQPVSTILNFG